MGVKGFICICSIMCVLCLQEDEINVLDQDVADITEDICVAEGEARQAKEEVVSVQNNIVDIQDRINLQIGEVENLNVSGWEGYVLCRSEGLGERERRARVGESEVCA